MRELNSDMGNQKNVAWDGKVEMGRIGSLRKQLDFGREEGLGSWK